MMRVLVTGSNGFVGRRLTDALRSNGMEIVGTSRERSLQSDCRYYNLLEEPSCSLLDGVDAVVHCAGLVHAGKATVDEFVSANVSATEKLANLAIKTGVKKFIYISSAKVFGEFSFEGKPFTADDQCAPVEPYGQSKLLAEVAIKRICENTAMQYIIIRPPLIYGPEVKANFLSLFSLVARGFPLPLGAIDKNKRSLVYIDNLVDLIRTCLSSYAARNLTLVVSDDKDVSTKQLLQLIAGALSVKSRLIYFPIKLIKFMGLLVGRKGVEQKLCSSLQVNIEHTKDVLKWNPPYSMEDGLRLTAEWFHKFGR